MCLAKTCLTISLRQPDGSAVGESRSGSFENNETILNERAVLRNSSSEDLSFYAIVMRIMRWHALGAGPDVRRS